jgi:hypothetical protein
MSDEQRMRFYTHPNMIKLPIGVQSEVMSIFDDVIKEDDYVSESVPELFSESVSELSEPYPY